MSEIIRVIVVDDSAFVRKTMRQMLSRSPFIEVVATARDGAEALELVEQLKPDVVTLDLTMPGTDGLAFLRTQMQRRPLPVIVVSMIAKSDEQVLEAFELGALDVIQKPTGLATDKVLEIADELVSKVKACAATKLSVIAAPLEITPEQPFPGSRSKRSTDIVVLGISTGGPQALKFLVPLLPADFPVPLVIVLHMPLGYTELFARSLNDVCSLEVREAREGDRPRPGTVYLAPAGHHLSFVRAQDGEVEMHLDLRPFDSPHRPSVDVLFRSASEIYGSRSLGVVMTGMGSDGTEGAAWIKAQGGRIIAEAEESCIVYGMPRSIVEAGLCDLTVPLGKMASSILGAL
ncbi:MAG: chemotaxis response regulator protein-glutamate methylesterase [Pirellula sp.]|nr:chemotaxis response regulator protein-glutamate methylesterase [Pirellula sp.]